LAVTFARGIPTARQSPGCRDFELSMTMTPNKSPEPTAVGAVSSAVAVHVAGRRWLSFFR
jgi:hypothetical protein